MDEIKICNCSVCGRETVGETTWRSMPSQTRGHDVLQMGFQPWGGRINNRPMCGPCLAISRPSDRPRKGKSCGEEDSPYQQNAIRDMEGER